MPLLLVLYLAPVLAAVLFWRAARRLPDVSVWRTLVAACEGRGALARSLAGAAVVATAVAALGTGPGGALAFLLGAALVALTSALAASVARSEDAAQPDSGATLAQALSAASVGALGALAWFFADPAGIEVLAAFAAGSSSAALFLAMSPGVREAVAQAGAPIPSHLAAVAAATMVAATAEPDALLPLGGLLAETETLRSELLLLPIAVTVISPLVAAGAAMAATAPGGRGLADVLAALERWTALLSAVVMLLLVGVSGLAWSVAAAFAIGLAARQSAVLLEEFAERSRFRTRKDTPPLATSLVSAAAIVCGERLAAGYGATLVALGMTAGFASAAAAAATRAMASTDRTAPGAGVDPVETAATVATGLALLVAASPALVSAGAQHGIAPSFFATAAPALLAGVLAGAVCAAAAARMAAPEDDADAVASASRAVAIAAALPAAVGMSLGAGAAVGVAMGFLAWSAASAAGEDDARLPRPVLLAWGRTMAISLLVAVPILS